MSRRIPFRNTSPYGWWLASYIERAQWDDDLDPKPQSRCLAWENTIILKAKTREAAYNKAIRLAKRNRSTFEDETGTRTGHWEFEGLTSLLPIFEPLEDGAEILWSEFENETIKSIRARTKEKSELEAFDDEG